MEIFKDLHIIVRNEIEKSMVVDGLKSIGFKWYSGDDECLCINVDCEGKDFMTCIDGNIWPDSEVLTANQFMGKYAMTELQKTIEAAKKQGYTNKTLSNALGKYDGYIARIISKPQSEKLQKFLVKEINELLVPVKIDDAMMISKQEYDELQGLRKELDHKNQVLDKRNDKYNLLEGEFNELKTHFDKQTKDSEKLIEANGQLVLEKEGLIRIINELEQQNKRVVDSNFELSDELTRINATLKECREISSSRYDRILDLEKDYWGRAEMHVAAENRLKKERTYSAIIFIALLVLFVISHLV